MCQVGEQVNSPVSGATRWITSVGDSSPAKVPAEGENAAPVHDVVVVGAGLAGLAAAWALRDRDVVLVESEDRVGGRVRSLRRDPYWLNLGAHLLGGPDMITRQLAGEFGLDTIVPEGLIAAVAMRGRVVRVRRAELLPFSLPLSLGARLSLIRTGLRLRRDERRVLRLDRGAILHSEDPQAYDSLVVDPTLEAVSLTEYLGRIHPDVEALFRVVANRGAGELDDTSADYGIGAFIGSFRYKRANVINGTEQLVGALVDRLGRAPITSARVVDVRQDPTGVNVEYADGSGNGVRQVRARAGVVAVPAPIARKIVPGLPEWKDRALAQVRYAPFLVAGMFTSERAPMPWDDIYAIASPDSSFCMFFNPASPFRNRRPRLPGGALVIYSAGERARALAERSDSEVRDRYLADLARIFPESRSIVDEVVIARWEYGGPTPFPGRSAIQRELAAGLGRISFAGDYLQYSGLDSAFQSGLRAATLARATLDGGPA
jgi:oxygen-dependent protoporphyrinogen oxidase